MIKVIDSNSIVFQLTKGTLLLALTERFCDLSYCYNKGRNCSYESPVKCGLESSLFVINFICSIKIHVDNVLCATCHNQKINVHLM